MCVYVLYTNNLTYNPDSRLLAYIRPLILGIKKLYFFRWSSDLKSTDHAIPSTSPSRVHSSMSLQPFHIS